MIGIYKITSPSGAVYIGQSKNIDRRLWYYKKLKCKKQTIIYNSLVKYGYDNHKVEILHCMETYDLKEINKLEREYIEQHITKGFRMMNVLMGGNVNEITVEHKNKIRERMKGSLNHFFGKTHTEETRARWSKIRKLKKTTLGKTWSVSDDKKKNMGKGNLGKSFIESHKLKMRDSSPQKKQIILIDNIGNEIKEYNSIGDAARELNINRVRISKFLIGTNKKCGDYLFKWKLTTQ